MNSFPGYHIERELGRGGMATVYLATQEALGRQVALKVMAPALAADQSFGERFLREGRTVAQLSHPNIPAIYDIGETGSSYYLTMEYLSGGDLKDRICQGPLLPHEVLVVLKQVVSALGYAHAMGFVHRDVKPENILFRVDGSVALTDFGIAKTVGSSTQMTGTGTSIGTPHYMSPEQARGQQVDGRSDLYSLGIVLYEMLVGQVPFDAQDSFAVAMRHINDPVPKLPRHVGKLQKLLDRLLAKDPAARFPDANRLIEAIDALIAGSLDRSNSDSTLSKGDRGQSKHKRSGLIWGVAGGVIALLLVAGVYILQDSGRRPMAFGGGGQTTTFSPASPASGTWEAKSHKELVRDMRSREPEPWKQLTIPGERLPVRGFPKLPDWLAQVSGFGGWDMVDGYTYDYTADNEEFRASFALEQSYQDEKRRNPYPEVVGRIERSELTRFYGLLFIRQPDTGKVYEKLKPLPQVTFDLFMKDGQIVDGAIRMPKGRIDKLEFGTISINLKDFTVFGKKGQDTKIQVRSEGFRLEARETLDVGPFEVSLSYPVIRPFRKLEAELRFDPFVVTEGGREELRFGPGELAFKAGERQRLLNNGRQAELTGYVRQWRLDGGTQRSTFDLSDIRLVSHLGGVGDSNQLQDDLLNLWDAFLNASGLAKGDYKSRRAADVEFAGILYSALARGIRLEENSIEFKKQGNKIQCRGDVDWDATIGQEAGKSGLDDNVFEKYCRLDLKLTGPEQLMTEMQAPLDFQALVADARRKNFIKSDELGNLLFHFKVVDGRLSINGHQN